MKQSGTTFDWLENYSTIRGVLNEHLIRPRYERHLAEMERKRQEEEEERIRKEAEEERLRAEKEALEEAKSLSSQQYEGSQQPSEAESGSYKEEKVDSEVPASSSHGGDGE